MYQALVMLQRLNREGEKMANYSNYTNKEMQAITIAKIIEDGQIVIVGTGLPLIGASLAKRVLLQIVNL